MVLTLQSVDEKVFEVVRKMGFDPVLNTQKDIKVRVEHRDDVLKILNAIRDAGALYFGFGSSKTQP